MPTPMRRTLTLGVDPGFALPELDGEVLEGRLFEVTYFDTPERRLAAADVTLRRHVENGRSRWLLELRGGEDRLEADGGPVPPVEVTRPLATLAVPRGDQISLWFEATSATGCHAYDSNMNANYHYAIEN